MMRGVKGYPLDGHVNRDLEGKTIELVSKDGYTMTVHTSTGEKFVLAWVDKNGDVIEGEPCLVKVNVVVRPFGVSLTGKPGTV